MKKRPPRAQALWALSSMALCNSGENMRAVPGAGLSEVRLPAILEWTIFSIPLTPLLHQISHWAWLHRSYLHHHLHLAQPSCRNVSPHAEMSRGLRLLLRLADIFLKYS